MTGRSAVLLMLIVATIPATTAQQDAPQSPSVFRSQATAVSLDVSVRRGNLPVAGLTAADFVLTDNGVQQQIDQVLTDVVPIDVTLIIDASGSTATMFKDIRQDGQRILGLLRPQDRARIMVIETVPYELLPMQTVGSSVTLPERLPAGTWSSVHDAILGGLMTRRDPDRRRLLVAITDGLDTKSITSVHALEGVVRRTDTVLHVISVRPGVGPGPGPTLGLGQSLGLGQASAPAEQPARRQSTGYGVTRGPVTSERALFESLPAISGGAFHGPGPDSSFPSGIDVVDAVRDVFEQFRHSYVVQYQPRGVMGGWHTVVVRVKGVNASGVRTRAGYFDAVP